MSTYSRDMNTLTELVERQGLVEVLDMLSSVAIDKSGWAADDKRNGAYRARYWRDASARLSKLRAWAAGYACFRVEA